MQLQNGSHLFSASDLVHFLECEHLTVLDLQHTSGDLPLVQKTELDESAALIARKDNEHERAYLDRLRAEGRLVLDIAAEGGSTDDKAART